MLETCSVKFVSPEHLNNLFEKWQFVPKGPVKLIQQIKTAHSFLQLVSNLFHFYHFKLAYVVLHIAALKPISKNGEIGCFNQSLLIESF